MPIMETAKKKQAKSKRIGDKGERQALEYLLQKGYQLLVKNYRYKRWEIDLIMLDKQTNELVFVEVKTRSNNQAGEPAAAVTQAKINHLHQAAQAYIQTKQLDHYYRFDVISIVPNQIEHLENVTAQ